MNFTEKDEKKEWFLASPVQYRVYMSDIVEPGKTRYNATVRITYEGKIQKEKLIKAIDDSLSRIDILRAQFRYESGKLEYYISNRKSDVEIIEYDSDMNIEELKEKALDGFVKPFSMTGDILYRVRVAFLQDKAACMILDCHHIISDGYSSFIYAKDLQCFYENKPIEEKKYTYEDFSKWQWEYVQSEEYEHKKNYWRNIFAEPVQQCEFLESRTVKTDESGHTDIETMNITKDEIVEACNKNRILEYSFWVAAVSLTLGRLSNQSDITLGTIASGRNKGFTKKIIGMFVNTFPIRTVIDENDTVEYYLKKVHKTVMMSLKNSDVQYADILQAANETNPNNLFQTLLRFQNTYEDAIQLDQLSCKTEEIMSSDSIFNSTIVVKRFPDRYNVTMSYRDDIYSKTKIQNLFTYLQFTIQSMLKHLKDTVKSLPLCDELDYKKICNDFNQSSYDYPKDKTVVQLFEEQVELAPDHTAVEFEDEKLSYRELNEKANIVAHRLREKGVKPDDFVAIIADRSIEMVAIIFGVMKASGGYVPLDPTYPEDRIQFILEDCKPKLLIKYTKDEVDLPSDLPIIQLEDIKLWNGVTENPEHINKPSDMAYCIYTSGTTGKPKGTLIEHQGLVNLKYVFLDMLGITQKDKFIQFANYVFDASVAEMMSPLLNGATLVCLPACVAQDGKEFSEYCRKHNVTLATLPPNYYVQKEVDIQLRQLVTAGSEASFNLIKKLGNQTYINGYGPTESTVCATYWRRDPNWNDTRIPIGRPRLNAQIYIMQNDKLCGIGVPGELCIAGVGLAREYLNQPKLTEQKFVNNPFGEGRMYHSGDLARWLPDGNIEYLGRIDEQVKIRGFRIELGEIDNRVRDIDGVNDCAVIAKEDKNGDKAIYAYYTGEENNISIIREKLSEVLPSYMIPSYIMKIERIPVTPSGKVNRRALPDIEFKLSGEYVAPTNEKERVICETFCNILDLKRVGIKDNFFELGGDSIKALRIISLLRTKGYHVTVKDIMNRKTVEKIATVLKEEHETLHYEQGEVSGTVKKTPIIQLFDAWNLVNPAHFNQAMMFPVDGIEIPVIKKAIETLVKHHDVLRGVYQNEELTILPIAESKLYDLYEYDYRKTADVVHAISEECTKIQGSINLEDGPFVKIAVFTTDDTKVMMFCIHHLVVDGVSWRILAEDFKTAVEQIIKGEEVKLPEKTASFIEWSNLLEEYSNRLSEKEKLYWEQIDARIIYAKINNASAKEDKDCSVVDSKVRYVSQLDFSKEFTEKILKQASSICGAKVNEVLLSGIARTIGQMTGQEKIAINLESHGREKLHKTIDIDRTVGWFTNIYPVILDCTQDIRHSVIGAKEAVRSVPNGGIGYGCHMTSKERNQSDISFNYLGELDEVGTQENYNCGDNFATENATDDLILINGMTSHGKMQFIIVSQDERFDQNFIDDFTNCFEKAMKEIIEYCSESSQVEKTASDYELYDISVDEFEYLQNEFEGEVNKIYELTPLQEGMLFHNVVDTSSTAYVLQTVLNIDTEMESERVKQALHLLSLRYEVLRTAIIYENVVEPKQVIYQEREPEFHVLDFSTFSVEDKKQALDDLIQEDVIRGFHLQSDSLLRVTFVKYGEKNIKLIWSMHHIIVDGWCLQALMSKFMEYYYRLDQGAFYDNIVRSIKEEVYSQGTYSDYIYWIRRQDQSTAKEYWRSLLCDYENDCELRPMATPMQCKDQMRRCSIQLNEDVTSQLKKYAKDQEITLSTIVETICGLVLQRYTGSNDVVFGKVVSGRNAEIPGIEKMVGLFINTIPVRVHVKKNMLVKDLIKEQQKQSNESTNHDYISLAEIQNQTIQGNELIKVLYVFENYSSGLQTENEDVLNQFISVEQTREQTNYDITISAYESDGKLEYALMYQPNRYVEEEMMLLLKRLVQVSKEIAISLDKHVEEIDSITKEEQEIILNSFDAADVDYPREKTVLALFEEQVEKNPDRIAVSYEGEELSYKQLNEMANVLAHKLRALGVKKEEYVALYMERSLEMVIAIYGVLKAGGVYVPINTMYPKGRVEYILNDCKAKILLTNTELHNVEFNGVRIMVRKEELVETSDYLKSNLSIVQTPESRMYVIYTSGTTGQPKGVEIMHKNVVRLLFNDAFEYDFGEEDIWTMFHSYGFDFSVWEMYGSTLYGGKLIIVSEERTKDPSKFAELLIDEKVTVLNQVPTAFYNLIREPKAKEIVVRYLIFGGEALNPTYLKEWASYHPTTKIVNMYGITETTVHVTYREIGEKEIERGISDIGKAIPTLKTYIMNGDKLCGFGEPGELCVTGEGLAKGYVNLSELTKEKFVQNPFGEGRMYRSGDLARLLTDGNIEYLGRIDEQVQVRGFRIELGEIESRIQSMDGIQSCAVIVREDSINEKAIYAYYVSEHELSVSDIRDWVGTTLPEYMIPAYIMRIDSIPVTANGKLDKRALPEIDLKISKEYIAPRDAKEAKLCEAFCKILNVETIGVKDNFYELGGDSIKALRIISILRSTGYQLTVKDIMNQKTVERIAAVMREEHEKIQYEQGEISGTVKKTQIIKIFDEWNLTHPEHFNQAMMFPVSGIETSLIKKAMEELVKHHDMLRACYRNKELVILPIAESKLFDFYEFDYRKKEDVVRAISEQCSKIQASIKLETGPLVKIAVFETIDAKVMMFCIHHLAVDGVSWRILAEDFKNAVEQIRRKEEVKLPEKTASFIEWSNQIEEYSKRLSEKEKVYWEHVNKKIENAKISTEAWKDVSNDNQLREKSACINRFDLSNEMTEEILKKSGSSCGAKVNEVLISCIARAIGSMTGQKKIAVNLEGHGREQIHETIDIDRTVGWFTTIYPVILDCTQDIRLSLIDAKETVRSVPNGGLGYGCHLFSQEKNQSDISFNYLGELDEVGIQETYNCGDDVAKENRTNDKILVNVMTVHGKMHFVIISQDRKFTQTFVDDFADHIQKSMKETIEYCSECREVEKTASDYQLYDLSNDQFEGLKKELAGEVLKIYELTPLQEGMLFHNLSETSSTAYVLQTIYNIDAELNSERVKQALRLLSIRYEVLRTAFIYENVIEPKQVIYQVREPEFHVEDYMNLAKDEKLRVFEQLIQADVARGFNLQKDPLLRVTFVEYDINKIRLVWSMHHIIVDGWCIQVLMRRFMEYYNLLDQDGSYDEIVKSVKEEQNQQGSYSEYIYWLRKQDQQNAKEYWRQLLGDYENECELRPMSSPSECKEQMRRSSVKVNKNITAQLKKYAKEQEITISTIVETICGLVLQTSTGNKDIVFGKVVSGRNAKIQGIEDMVGLFINTIPVRVRSEKDMLIKDLMIEQQKQSNESTNYDYISLAEIQNQTVQGKDLIKVLYVFENYTSGLQEDKNETDLDTLVSVEQIREQTNYGISIAAFETEEKLEYSVMYQPNRYVEEEISLFLNRLVKVSEEIAQSFDRKVEEIDSLTKKEQDIILGKFNGTQVDYPREKTVVDLFEEQVLLTPDKIAVVYDIQSITYHKLNEKVNSLAHILRDNGVEPDDLVAIIADRSIEMVQGIYGIMKAGGAYVPIDPTYPSERIQFILEDCKAKVVLKYTKEDIALPDGLTCIDLSVPDIFEGVVGNPVHKNQADDLVYCIYTSGTTGQPKGTLIEHQGVVNLKYMFVDMLGITSEDNVLQFANYVFDASVWEMTMALLNGATLVCMPQVIAQDPQEFSRYCKENHVTIATLPPNYYIQKDVEIQLRALITAGSESSMNIMKKLGNGVYFNAYGPTESTVCATYWKKPKEWNGSIIPIGNPIMNTEVYIMNNNKLCGIGVPGELCIAGLGLARGYLNQPKLTNEKFVKNPFGDGRMYHSGDLARWLPDGTIEYLGRIDEQVKIRGFRIELGEIDSRIRDLDGVNDCAVIAREDKSGEKAIYAYYTGEEISTSAIRDKLTEVLPSYMIPSYIMKIDAIPVTRNGKLDKRALPEIETAKTRSYEAPRNRVEEQICNIYREILQVEQVGIQDDFFELGGHSLRATRLVNRIESEIGIRVPLKEVFTHSKVVQLAEIIRDSCTEKEEYCAIPKAEPKEYYSMSSAQKRTYLMQQMQPESILYNMPLNFKITGEIRIDDMKKALQEVISRHEILRTQFLIVDGEPVQRIMDEVFVPFEYIQSKEEDEQLIAEYLQPFDLSNPPLVRMKLVDKGTYHLMMMDMHHIVGDGMSIGTFTREFMSLYNGEILPLLAHQFKDYSEWMRTRDLSSQAEYWMKQFEDEIPVLELPTDYTRPQEQSYVGAITRSIIDEKLSQQIRNMAKETGTTEYMIFLAAAMITLGKYSRQEDIVIGSPISGRTHRDTEDMLGMFVNTLAMRGKPERTKSIKSFLEEIKESCLKAQENQEFPFEELVEAVDVERDLSRSPLFDVLLVMQNNEQAQFMLDGCTVVRLDDQGTVAKFDLSFYIDGNNGKYDILLEYCTDLFKKETVDRLLVHYVCVLKSIVANREQNICDVEMITEDEKNLILREFNATKIDYPRTKTVVELFEEQVEQMPDQLALIYESEKITYKTLNERVNSLAHFLRKQGVQPDDFVAIIADRSIEMVEGIYGIMKAGGAYVPIDPTYPAERINFILEDCKPKAILKNTKEQIDLPQDVSMIDLQEEDVWNGLTENPPRVNTPNNLIYCIYTSGTTGKPKGVMIKHSNVVNYATDYEQGIMHLAIKNNYKRMAAVTNLSFDIHVTELIFTLLNGMTVYVANKDEQENTEPFDKLVCKNQIQVLQTTPSRMKLYLMDKEHKEYLKQLKLVLLGGEKVGIDVVKQIRTYSEAIIENVYGPSETTVWSTSGIVSEDSDLEEISIGKPILNTQIYIMNDELLCGIGVPGELYIAGDGLARGYLNRPDLTEEKFRNNPYGDGKLYHTGDLAKWLPDGTIEYLGRIDEQVKIRGFRIELGEIESGIRAIDGVRNCAVIARDDKNNEKEIYAYYTGKDMEVSFIRDKLREVLPSYMIPSYLMRIDTIPVTINGKLDKRALPDIKMEITKEYLAPRDKIEEIVCNIYKEILRVEQVGIQDNFFELGGHSLRATRLVNQIESDTSVRIALKDVFSHPKVVELAGLIKETMREKEKYVSIPVAESKEYYAMSSAQKRTFLMQQMQPESVAYNMPQNLKLTGKIRPDDMKRALQKMVSRHEILRTQFLMMNGEPVQKIMDEIEVEFEYVKSNESDEQLMREYLQPFDLTNPPLVRMRLVDKGDYHLLMMDMHHIVGDGMSVGTFTKEFISLYNGESLAELTHQFKDYSEWMRTRDLSSQAEYWKKQFADEIPVLDLPTDYPRPQEQSYVGTLINTVIDENLSHQIKKLVNKTGTTDYMVFLAAAMVTLGKYSRQEDMVIGSAISGRTHKDTEGMLGMFVNTLAMRGKPQGTKSFRAFLEEIKQSCLKAYENQEYPFEELIAAIDVTRDVSRNPLYDVMLIMQNNEQVSLSLDGCVTERAKVYSTVSKLDLTFNIGESNGRYSILLEYSTDLFKQDTVERLLAHYVSVLKSIVSDETQKINSIAMITEEEKNLIVNNFNSTQRDYPKNKTIVELFEEKVELFSNQLALVFESDSMTYSQFNNKVNSLAHVLRKQGVKPNDFIAIIADRSMEMVEAVYGVIKAGGAYVPIEPTYPEERIHLILEDCKPKAILKFTYEEIEFPEGLPVIDLHNPNVWNGITDNPEKVNKPEDIIYCIYTSGTTGRPKGVMVQHSNVVNFTTDYDGGIYNLATKHNYNKMVAVGNYSFDISITEIFYTLVNGMTIYLANRKEQETPVAFDHLVCKNDIQILQTTPSRMKLYLIDEEHREFLKHLKLIILGGEKVGVDIVKQLRTYSDAIIEDAYGPSETTVWSTSELINNEDDLEEISIGKPILNTQIYIMNDNQLCGIGVPGELCIAGNGVTKGYLNRSELTNEKFKNNPFGEGKLYHTGDLARWLPNGKIQYLGRIDEQVKIRGFRIELGEIQSRMREIDHIKDCAVIAREDRNNDKAIFAYYVSDMELSNLDIRECLSNTLPEYMIPAYIMRIEKIPVTSNGKLDKRALPNIEMEISNEYVPPRNEKESVLCAVCCKIFNMDYISVKDNFYEIGGDSIKAIRMIDALKHNGYELAMKDIIKEKVMDKIALKMSSLDVNMDSRRGVVRVSQTSFFERVKDELMVESLLKDAKERYSRSFATSRIEKSYHILPIQKIFFNEAFVQICDIKFEIDDKYTSEEIKEALRKLVKEQSILRSTYRRSTQTVYEYEYCKQLDIPYMDSSMDDSMIESMLKYSIPFEKGNEWFSDGEILSFITVVQKQNGGHYIMLYIHHGIYDQFSNIIFRERLNYYLDKHDVTKVQRYSDYVERLELLEESKPYSKEFESLFQQSMQTIHNLIAVRSLSTDVERKPCKSFYVTCTSPIRHELIEIINEKPIENFMKLFTLMNPIFSDLEMLPFMLLHHGRMQEDNDLVGLHLDMLPGIYHFRENEIKGALNIIRNNRDRQKPILDEDLYAIINNNQNICYCMNYQSMFEEEFKQFDFSSELFIDLHEFSYNEIKCGIINNTLLFAAPIYASSIEEAMRQCEEQFKVFIDWLTE